MDRKKTRILGIVLFFGIIMHFYVGYFHWDIIDGIKGTDILYSITGYFLMDVTGLILIILCEHLKANSLKVAGLLLMILATYFIYMEFNDPYNWRVVDYKLLAILCISFLNLFFIYYFTDLLKKNSDL